MKLNRIAALTLAASLAAPSASAFKAVFSADGSTAGSSARECPSQGVDLQTGKVVVGLHALSDARRAACGWYRLVPTPPPAATNGVRYAATGFAFSADGTCAPVWTARPIPAKPARYSKLLIVRALKAMPCDGGGTMWDALKAKMGEMGILDEWSVCTWIAGDDPALVAAKPALAAFLGMDEAALDALLAECLY